MGQAQLTQWLASPSPDSVVTFLESDWSWTTTTYPELAERVLQIAGAIRANGLTGNRIAISAVSPRSFVEQFFGVLAAGATCVPIATRAGVRSGASADRLEAVIDVAKPAAALPADSPLPALDVIDIDGARPLEPERAHPPTDAPALIQFSSGSTGRPRGIRISHRALEANVAAIASWLRMVPSDVTATWLPLYHDMGLIGTMLTPVATQTELRMMTPLQFLKRPQAWIACFDRAKGGRGTIAASPPFGYQHAARRTPEGALEHADLSGWRIAIVGAEPIRRHALDEFRARFEPFGFPESAFCPAYGLAEATLAVTGTPATEPPRCAPPAEGFDRSLVSSGRPLDGMRVGVHGDDGPCADGQVGEIFVAGSSLADGYDAADGAATTFDEWLATGDIGVMIEGELFVFGRASDSFKVHGRPVLAEDVEHFVTSLHPTQSVVVVPARREGAGLTVVVEGPAWDDAEAKQLQESVSGMYGGCDVDVRFVRRGAVPRTTSGKPRRRMCWHELVERS